VRLKERVDEKKDEYGYRPGAGNGSHAGPRSLAVRCRPSQGHPSDSGEDQRIHSPRIAQRVSLAEEPLAVSVDTAQVRIHSRQGEFRRGSEIP
jgi:hypothetical protein